MPKIVFTTETKVKFSFAVIDKEYTRKCVLRVVTVREGMDE